ncbi:MAG: GatB/YqeY domain-containing protein [Proteobacteria bacterium]|nr:GatB/YqeY domain-containing protein [Pseudomonadota bacterium]MBU4295334.1 GatB/YqeY domain-containing protein [Pseudomonadota bacterium]MCG2748190.1 GatB/YqeY domain-containing protein [Desulfobulbaceae bacterium]
MTLQEKIRTDLKVSMKAKTEERTSALRVLIGEFQRQVKKELADAEVIAIIRKLIKSEVETLEKKGEGPSEYMQILESYLPKQATEAEIRAWIEKNIDISKFPSKMQAMKPIMANFAGMVDGNTVKKILESL